MGNKNFFGKLFSKKTTKSFPKRRTFFFVLSFQLLKFDKGTNDLDIRTKGHIFYRQKNTGTYKFRQKNKTTYIL